MKNIWSVLYKDPYWLSSAANLVISISPHKLSRLSLEKGSKVTLAHRKSVSAPALTYISSCQNVQQNDIE